MEELPFVKKGDIWRRFVLIVASFSPLYMGTMNSMHAIVRIEVNKKYGRIGTNNRSWSCNFCLLNLSFHY
jgi:hypothetical protein